MKDARAALLARHLTGGNQLEGELALLASLSADKQATVFKRLSVLDGYLAKTSPTSADADLAAAQIGVARRQLYRLLAKVSEVGPVRALSPGYRNVERSAPSKDGLPEPIEAIVRQTLFGQPDAKIAQIEAAVREECNRFEDLSFPGQTAIRRRVHALRRLALVPRPKDGVGARIAVDQVCLDLTIHTAGNPRLSIATFIIDRDTRLILGAGLTAQDGVGQGLADAVKDADRRLAGFQRKSLLVAGQITELMWIVPPGLERFADSISSGDLPAGRKPVIDVVGAGPRRHGDAILRLLGDKIGRFRFRRNVELTDEPPLSGEIPVYLDDGQRLLGFTIDSWNDRILSDITQGPKICPKHAKRLDQLAGDLTTILSLIARKVAEEHAAALKQQHMSDSSL